MGIPNTCVIAVMGMDFSDNFYILGDVFLRSYYSTYNLDKNEIGLGLSINSTGSVIRYTS